MTTPTMPPTAATIMPAQKPTGWAITVKTPATQKPTKAIVTPVQGLPELLGPVGVGLGGPGRSRRARGCVPVVPVVPAGHARPVPAADEGDQAAGEEQGAPGGGDHRPGGRGAPGDGRAGQAGG